MSSTINRLLGALSPPACERLLSICKPIDLPLHTTLYVAGEPIRYAYFIDSGAASIIIGFPQGETAEVTLSGNESVIGASALLGPRKPVTSCIMQIAGVARRCSIKDLGEIFEESPEFRTLLLEYVQTQTIVLDQIAACSRLHRATERLARWLLTAADLSHSRRVTLTQESISQMLGTRRTTVALVAGTLQRSGIIRYRRGRVEILDHELLSEAACSCYNITRDLIANLYSGAKDDVA